MHPHSPEDSREARQAVTARLEAAHAHPVLIRSFLRQYDNLVQGATGLIPEATIEPPQDLPDAKSVRQHEADGRAALPQTLVIKLNGGLGTSMGLNKAKSLLPVKNGLTFLDILAGQILRLRRDTTGGNPLVLMNSVSTDADTREALARHPEREATQAGVPLSFLQHRVPKILQDSLRPAEWPENPALEWCPPGHGDLYSAVVTSGLLPRLLEQGYSYAFVSNADNLGATLDLGLLGYFAAHEVPFMMEVTDRTEADRKGGHLCRSKDGRFLLREIAQCASDEVESFQDIRTYRYFNTNNLWLNLRALDRLLQETDNVLDLPLIVNRKTLDPRNPASPPVFQLETAMGSALALFPEARALRVPRTRFAPVKTTADLLALWSDAYELTEAMHVVLRPQRQGIPPRIELDPGPYRLLEDFESRFPHGAPSLLECESLAVEGDIRFGRGISFTGAVRLRHASPGQAVVRDGTCFDAAGGERVWEV